MSKVFLRPVWQAALPLGGANRLVPDLAEDAAVVTGITIWHEGKSFTVGGTSLAAPLVAAQLAAVEARHTGGAATGLGDIHPQLYRAAGTFADVSATAPRSISVVHPILAGYDAATGLGTPNWGQLEAALYAPAPAAGGAPAAKVPAATTNGIIRPNLRASGVAASRWYVSYGHDAGCWGAGTAKAPGTLTPGEGAVRVFVHTATTGLVCSPVRSFVVTSPVDDRHARKAGPWKAAPAARAYHRTLLESAKAGATLSYTGSGKHFAVLVTTGPGFGQVQVLLDGKVVGGTRDLGTGKRRFEVLIPATARKAGRHTIAVRVLGTAGAGGKPVVAVDGFLAAP
jgi:hypothetical protein